MTRIARALDMPIRFFLTSATAEDETWTVFYRSMSAATKAARTKAKRRYGWLRRVVAWLRTYVTFPQVRFPAFDLPAQAERIGEDDIEDIASKVRAYWGIEAGPVPNVTALLEGAGAIVVRMELQADTLDAFSEWREREQRPYVILGTDKASAVRSRYDASHELGHMILHRKIPPEALCNAATFKLVEKQAHHFAGAFLLPGDAFADDLYISGLHTYLALKAKWQVSIAAMLKRSSQLNLISPDRAQRLWRNLARRGWRTREPLDDELPVEEPSLVRDSFSLLLNKRIVVPGAIEAQLGIGLRDIEDVCGLQQGTLDQRVAPVLLFPKRNGG
jgi:Zn-dependent peptidase ImmA (M78 family)